MNDVDRKKSMKKTFREKLSKENIKRYAADMALLFLACSAGSFSTVAVMIPNGLTSGGITGISRMVQNYVSLDFSVIYYLLCLIIVIIVAISLGSNEVKKIIVLSVMYPVVLFIFERFNVELLEEKDMILAAIFCGAFSGVAVGIAFWRGYSYGGTDSLAKIIRKKFLPHVSQSKILLVIDGIIIIGSAFVFGRNIALYALVTQVIVSKTIDVVMYGFESKIVQLEIITENREELSKFILEDIRRGVTTTKVVGEYTHNTYAEMRLLCSPRECVYVRREIAKIDPNAFVTMIQVDNVWALGEGFQNIKKED